MNPSLYLEKLYHKNIVINKTNLGLTNDVYKVTIDGENYALRVPKDDISCILGNHEIKALNLIKNIDLDVEEVFYDANNRYRMTKWIDNYKEFKDSDDDNKYIRATRLIKRLHSFSFKTDYVFNPYKMYLEFKNQIKKPLLDYQLYEHFFDDFNNLDYEKILCHNDLVSGNILLSNNKDYLIDYEYAGMNHPYFDLMSFISENNIDDEDIRKQIYFEYFGYEINQNILNELRIIENMQNLLWAAWANMLYDSRNEKIYFDIFNDKIMHLKREI